MIKILPVNAGDIRDAGLIPGLEEGMAIHWRILWTEEPGGLWSMGSQSWTGWSNFAAAGQLCKNRRQASVLKPGRESHQNLTELAPWYWTSHLQNCQEMNFKQKLLRKILRRQKRKEEERKRKKLKTWQYVTTIWGRRVGRWVAFIAD